MFIELISKSYARIQNHHKFKFKNSKNDAMMLQMLETTERQISELSPRHILKKFVCLYTDSDRF